jgi:hypothetical protein
MFLMLVRPRCDRLIKHDALIVHGGEVLHQSFGKILVGHSKHMLCKEEQERQKKSGEECCGAKEEEKHSP